jgi:hypothetical protein
VTHEAFYDTYDTYEFYDTYFFPSGFIEVFVPKYILYVDEYHIVKLLNHFSTISSSIHDFWGLF